jgi:hypothetical protein
MSGDQLIDGDLLSEHPLVLGETLGWRAWTVIAERTRHPRLQSATHREMVWPTNRWTAATCGGGATCSRSSDGRIPGESCSCGLYAASDLEHLLDLGYAAYGERLGKATTVVGQVAFAGKVIPGSQGWRAEKGRIAHLYVPFSFDAGLKKRLSEVYNAPVDYAPWWATDPRLGVARRP